MERIKATIAALTGSAIGIGCLLCGTVGWAYWMWMAIKLGSFAMFFVGLLGPLGVIAGILGLWSLIFGAPLWLLHLFG
ncbi:maltose ABC transporter permease [Methylovirgula sp. 4M-Z18]|uniref:maltose ABC transporter permease n=1 Tax=Methylovirgula sp. 4M-Z18 TaxID=2293567 RepID=UPI000E2F3763|nr:maltose ABC transporter permease [Methylovirgula sp. 4M-Z18]RFB78308.1 maltose ABC transporter permease [Methylovirgula sp. 4M-Z18]